MRAWERVELVNDDPVACAIYTDRIFDVILNVPRDRRCSPFRPYVVRDYFKRVEFQQRGSAHVHAILCLENAPDEEELSGVDGAMPRTVAMWGRTKCRFGAPFMPSESTRIVVPFPPLPPLLADDAGGCDSTTEAERVRRQRLKAKYAEMHEALEHGEFANLDEFLRAFDVRSRDEYSEILRAGATRPHVLHPRTPAEKRERVRVRKTRDELDKLPASSTDVWKPKVIQKYEARCQPELENVCLADFVSKYVPIVQASAIAVHNSQGATYASVVYNYSRTHPQKLVYVALSRCTHLGALYLTNALGDHSFYHREDNPDRAMTDEFRRLENRRLQTVIGRYLDALRRE
ncbi:hypothetical protein HPB49_013372 [Dermacentor silvarum]|uniref:Uncharacterized protein n=1 Tax=Dermacentor silvarum TaxID=543639 RepID=A0ACB8DD81_DERSI|nr:hypothetical protein HPB49_013372 [Dermacentor silvarum]